MSQVVQGVVRGGKIELVNGPELADGQRVQVVIGAPAEPVKAPSPPEEGTVHTPLTDPVLIDLLARIRRERPPLPPSPTGPGRKSAAGMLADDPDFGAHMAEIERYRRSATFRDPAE
jgi:hypothetical protein